MSPTSRRGRVARSSHDREEEAGAGIGAWGETRGPPHNPFRAPSAPRERFRHLDRYRVDREWQRYEGTAQRDLFRVLRNRFLLRHARREGWALEIGPGPGRFSPRIGLDPRQRVVIDLSREALRSLSERWPTFTDSSRPHRIQGDAVRPPLKPGSFDLVVALGNSMGFAGSDADRWLEATLGLLGPDGTILLETVAGPGECSSYLARLPVGAVGRLLASPPSALRPRLLREGFRARPDAGSPDEHFRRQSEAELTRTLARFGVEVTESIAVAPLLGADRMRIQAVAQDARRWAHLLALEEEFGRMPARRATAAALLLAGRRNRAKNTLK